MVGEAARSAARVLHKSSTLQRAVSTRELRSNMVFMALP
jgi:hypothetical protein